MNFQFTKRREQELENNSSERYRTMPRGIPRDKSTNRMILHRLKITRGHLDKVIKMVEDGDYCINVVHQSIAVQSALKKVDQVILENHLKSCVADSVNKGNSREFVDEVIKVLEKK